MRCARGRGSARDLQVARASEREGAKRERCPLRSDIMRSRAISLIAALIILHHNHLERQLVNYCEHKYRVSACWQETAMVLTLS